MAAHANEHAHQLLRQLIARRPWVVVDDVLLGDERGEVVEQRGLVVLDEQEVGVLFVVQDGAGVGVETAPRPAWVRVGCDRG